MAPCRPFHPCCEKYGLDEDFQREQQQREARTQGQLGEIETTRQARRKAIDEEERGTLGELDKEKDARHNAR